VRVADGCRRPGLAQESLRRRLPLPLGPAEVRELDSDDAAQLRVLGAVDRTHAPGTESVQNPVAPNPLRRRRSHPVPWACRRLQGAQPADQVIHEHRGVRLVLKRLGTHRPDEGGSIHQRPDRLKADIALHQMLFLSPNVRLGKLAEHQAAEIF
jgi:hypothetical protein